MKTGLKIKLIRKERQFGVWVWLLALWAVSWLIDSKERKKRSVGSWDGFGSGLRNSFEFAKLICVYGVCVCEYPKTSVRTHRRDVW